MMLGTRILLAAGFIVLASAQVSYDKATDTWTCPIANGSYCVQDSLSSPMIVLCTNGIGMQGNCMGHTGSRPPIESSFAPCWQSSIYSGDAACSKNCTVFPDEGDPFSVPGTCNPTATMTASGSFLATVTSISTIIGGSSGAPWTSSAMIQGSGVPSGYAGTSAGTGKLYPTSIRSGNATSKATTRQTGATTSRTSAAATSKTGYSETGVSGTATGTATSSLTGGAVFVGDVARSAAGFASAFAMVMFAAALLL